MKFKQNKCGASGEIALKNCLLRIKNCCDNESQFIDGHYVVDSFDALAAAIGCISFNIDLIINDILEMRDDMCFDSLD